MPVFNLTNNTVMPDDFITKPFSITMNVSNLNRLNHNYIVFIDLETMGLLGKLSDNVLYVPHITEYSLVVFNKDKNCIEKTITKYFTSTNKEITYPNIEEYIVELANVIINLSKEYEGDMCLVAHNGFNFDYIIMNYLFIYANVKNDILNTIPLFDSLVIARDHIGISKNYKNVTLFESLKDNFEDLEKFNNLILNIHTAEADALMTMYWFIPMLRRNKIEVEYNCAYFKDLFVTNENNIKVLNVDFIEEDDEFF